MVLGKTSRANHFSASPEVQEQTGDTSILQNNNAEEQAGASANLQNINNSAEEQVGAFVNL
jgi:hypothetical protein